MDLEPYRHFPGLLDEEAAALAGLTKEQGHKRCADLRKGDPAWIVPLEDARLGTDGQLARQCVITVAGLRAFRQFLGGATSVEMTLPRAHARNEDPWTSHRGVPTTIRINSQLRRLLYCYALHELDRQAHGFEP